MVRPDWDAPEFKLPDAGTYLVEVKKCELKHGPKSDYFAVRLADPDTNQTVAFDNIMLTGGGAGMGVGKLTALGFQKGSSMEAEELVGRRCYVAVVEESYKGNDGALKTKMVVDANAKGSHRGYWSEAEYDDGGGAHDIAPPLGFPKDSGDIPF